MIGRNVLSGMRPTGKLHIGHLEGVLQEWINLQQSYDCYYFVADWHALTTNSETKDLKENTIDMVKDWLAYGVDPNKSTLFIQSQVPEHAELGLLFSMLVNLGRLERLPTFNAYLKEIVKVEEKDKKIYDEVKRAKVNHGFLGYPILQSADILIYKTNLVPVGEDQLSHIELTREIARKFNSLYKEIFPIPEPKLGETPCILGTDSRKMSKSYGNVISPTDDYSILKNKVGKMVTDPNKIRANDRGNPDVCSVFDMHELYHPNKLEVLTMCKEGSIGCFDCKGNLARNIYDKYEEFNEKRSEFSDNDILEILEEGSKKARSIARQTLNEVKEAMHMDYF